MLEDPEARGSEIVLDQQEVHEEIIIEEWADLQVVNIPYESIDLVFNRQ
jgi:hypothetical protein